MIIKSAPSQVWRSETARSDAHWGRSGAVITVHGEVDAANADSFGEHVERCAAYCEWLVLDLSALDFAATAAVPALRAVSDRCAALGLSWALVPGPAVSRVLRVCAPDHALPLSESLNDALAAVQNQHLHPELIAL